MLEVNEDELYDANGNLTSDGTHNYTWDAEGLSLIHIYPPEPTGRTWPLQMPKRLDSA